MAHNADVWNCIYTQKEPTKLLKMENIQNVSLIHLSTMLYNLAILKKFQILRIIDNKKV